MANCEVVNGALVVQGNLDKASDPDFQSALEHYCAKAAESERILDLTNVRWLNNTIAKMIINSGTDVLDKGTRLRVVSSRHVQQTLNLLGAQSYITIEAAAARPAPTAVAVSDAPPEAAKPAELMGLDDADLMMPASGAAASAPSGSATPSAPNANGGAAASFDSGVAPRPAPPAPRVIASLAAPHEELSRGAVLFRVLQIDKRYSFLVNGIEVVGTVRERLGGSWVLIDSSGRRKFLNLDAVQLIEVM